MRQYGCGLAVLFTLAAAHAAAAQAVVAPATATFTHTDADFAITATYHVDFFQCGSVTIQGVCQNRAATPFQSGLDVPKAQVTGTALARVINLKAAPASGVLVSLPIGVGFIATIKAVGDTTQPGVGGTSVASNDSNPFFAQARTPAAPGSLVVQ